MSESETESSISEVKDDENVDHVEEEQRSATSEEDLTAGMGLQILAGSMVHYDPEGGDARPFDVVAVHGYHGDRHTSWGGPYNNWLEYSLFPQYPSSRILTFGYDAHGIKGTSTRAGIRQKAVQLLDELVKLRNPTEPELFRPLIFVSQDLGGIIVKEASRN
ncbi:hypothetical protein IFR05_009909 [Cadophora sp. M221]|nr:hypothetical protein IFR05_009909 [Cadophora sp. M221]